MDVIYAEAEEMSKKLGNEYVIYGDHLHFSSSFSKHADVIYNLEDTARDFNHNRNSGINHVIAREMKERDIIYAFNFNLVFKDIPRILGRMQQNVTLLRKAGVKMVVCSFAKKPYEVRVLKDLESFAKEIGMNTQEIVASRTVISERIKRNKKRSKGEWVNGAEKV